MDSFKRILRSRKVQTGLAGIFGAVIAVWSEVDYTQEILTLITVVTGTLVGGQAFVDGQNSDGAPSDRPR